MQQQSFYVYMLASIKGALYIGMTRDIAVRMEQHRLGSATGFSSDYRTTKLVWCEVPESFESAREREVQLKCWRRSKKAALIEINNPYREDISTQVA
jgi:putative endonuclease